jgi:hypothetical protein
VRAVLVLKYAPGHVATTGAHLMSCIAATLCLGRQTGVQIQHGRSSQRSLQMTSKGGTRRRFMMNKLTMAVAANMPKAFTGTISQVAVARNAAVVVKHDMQIAC